jgi:hypothetical protein
MVNMPPFVIDGVQAGKGSALWQGTLCQYRRESHANPVLVRRIDICGEAAAWSLTFTQTILTTTTIHISLAQKIQWQALDEHAS